MPLRCFVLSFVLAAVGATAQAQDGGLQPPTGTPRRPVGMSALAVRPGPVPFTLQDVAVYVKDHNLPKNEGAADTIQVASLEFMSMAKFAALIPGDTTGYSANDRIGLAILSGTLVFSGPPPGEPTEFSSGYAVFDAVTGNLLMIGTLAP